MSQQPDVSIILPVHNEADGVEMFINRVYNVLRSAAFSFEVICVENGSTDGTPEVLMRLQRSIPHLHVIESKKGWGNAVYAGIRQSAGVYVCYMVSDYQIDPIVIPKLYETAESASSPILVKVRRRSRENAMRKLNSHVYNAIAGALLGIRSGDINATPKMIRADVIKRYRFTSENIAFDLELLLYLKRDRIPWVEIPVHSRKRAGGVSKTTLRSAVEMIRHILMFRLRSFR